MFVERRLMIIPNREAARCANGPYNQDIQQQNGASGSEERSESGNSHDTLDFLQPENRCTEHGKRLFY
jgi:hypothetical protein